jgi:DNA-binding NarL/FixJ family response regulator
MLTNTASGAAIQECSQAGALGYIIKSDGTPSKLLQEIKKFLVEVQDRRFAKI